MVHILSRTLWLFAYLTLGCSTLSFAQEVRVSSDVSIQNFMPVYEKLLRSAGFKPHISIVPGERSFLMLKNGNVDMEYTRTKSAVASIADSVTLVGPVGCIQGVAFKRSGASFVISKPTDLVGYKVGVPMVHKTALEYAHKKNLNIELVNKRESLFRMLEAGRFDIAIDALSAGIKASKQPDLQGKIVRTGPILFSEPIYLVVNNRNRDWAARVQKALDEAVSSGAWQTDIGMANVAVELPSNFGLDCLKK